MAAPAKQQTEAERQGAERDALVALALRSYRGAGLQLRRNILASVARGADPSPAIQAALDLYAKPLADAMYAGYVHGRTRAAMAAATAAGTPPAVAAQAVTPPKADEDLLLAGLAVAAAVVLRRDVGDAIERRVREVMTAPGFPVQPAQRVAAARETLDSVGITVERPFLVETVVRDQAKAAFNAGQTDAATLIKAEPQRLVTVPPRGVETSFNAPPQVRTFVTPSGTAVEFPRVPVPTPAPEPSPAPEPDAPPAGGSGGGDTVPTAPVLKGWMYVTQRDERVRDTHRVLDGEVAAPEDAAKLALFEERLSDWNCRCELVPVYEVGSGNVASGRPL
jgi:hypothetical protein